MEICEMENCTGCFACINICPKNCIEMVEKEKGHIYPKINEKLCIQCNECRAVCQANQKTELHSPRKCYLGWSKSHEHRQKSTSGGIAYELFYSAIQKGFSAFGAVINESYGVEHVKIDKAEEVKRLQGSKYVHSYTNTTFLKARQDLNEGKSVIYIGTPCQIAGLKFFLKKEYQKLITCDLICHGVPSQKCLQEDARCILKTDIIADYKFSFRDKNGSGLNYKIFKDDKEVYNRPFYKNVFYLAFEMNLLQRECCYQCAYARIDRCSDITLGDFWGAKDVSREQKEKGLSLILANTEKGELFLEKMRDSIHMQEREIAEAMNGNVHLQKPVSRPIQEPKFKEKYKKKTLKKSLSPLLRPYRLKYAFLYEVVLKTPLKKLIH